MPSYSLPWEVEETIAFLQTRGLALLSEPPLHTSNFRPVLRWAFKALCISDQVLRILIREFSNQKALKSSPGSSFIPCATALAVLDHIVLCHLSDLKKGYRGPEERAGRDRGGSLSQYPLFSR